MGQPTCAMRYVQPRRMNSSSEMLAATYPVLGRWLWLAFQSAVLLDQEVGPAFDRSVRLALKTYARRHFHEFANHHLPIADYSRRLFFSARAPYSQPLRMTPSSGPVRSSGAAHYRFTGARRMFTKPRTRLQPPVSGVTGAPDGGQAAATKGGGRSAGANAVDWPFLINCGLRSSLAALGTDLFQSTR